MAIIIFYQINDIEKLENQLPSVINCSGEYYSDYNGKEEEIKISTILAYKSVLINVNLDRYTNFYVNFFKSIIILIHMT